jgi:transcriptional regulator with XRE-family HTH domain
MAPRLRARNALANWFRQQNGLTQTELAERINVNQADISRWLNGRPVPVRHWGRLAAVTGLSIETFIPKRVLKEASGQ